MKSSFGGSKLSRSVSGAKYTTGNVGVQENYSSRTSKKQRHTIEPPKTSTQHF